MTVLDRRLNAYRADLADRRLEGSVAAARYADGQPRQIVAPVADLRSAPSADAGLDTQLLLGDAVTVFDEAEGWAWVQSPHDGYVGYVAGADIGLPGDPPTHRVAAPRTILYREPDMKRPASRALSLGCAVRIVGETETRGTAYAMLNTGEAAIAAHLLPVGDSATDFVSVAERLELTPYLWGGASAFGIDCSGLVQLAMRMAGRAVLRDTDMQARSVGSEIEIGEDLAGLRRGDLVFWKGHVGIMTDGEGLIHANGHSMMVSHEPLREAVERIGYLYGRPTGFRRP